MACESVGIDLRTLQRWKARKGFGDNGSTLKATTVLAMLDWLGVKPSYSRPRVSDDNAYAESLLRNFRSGGRLPCKVPGRDRATFGEGGRRSFLRMFIRGVPK